MNSSFIRSKWYSNKHFRGSYSYQSLQTECENVKIKDLAEPLKTNYGKPVSQS